MHDLYVFDLDGTLVDSLPDITTALNAALLASGHAARALHEVRGFLGDGARELVRRAVGDGPSESALDDLVASYRARYGQALVRETRLYAGLEALLPTLPACAVLTNKPGREARAIVEALGLAARFVEVVGEGDGHPRKPDRPRSSPSSRARTRSVRSTSAIHTSMPRPRNAPASTLRSSSGDTARRPRGCVACAARKSSCAPRPRVRPAGRARVRASRARGCERDTRASSPSRRAA